MRVFFVGFAGRVATGLSFFTEVGAIPLTGFAEIEAIGLTGFALTEVIGLVRFEGVGVTSLERVELGSADFDLLTLLKKSSSSPDFWSIVLSSSFSSGVMSFSSCPYCPGSPLLTGSKLSSSLMLLTISMVCSSYDVAMRL